MQENLQKAKELVLARLRQKADFPAMSNTISLINKFKSSEEASVTEFANIILKDYALTSRILKLVNSVNYAQYGEVTTISRAIVLLGFESIKNLALTLMLFDHMQKGSSNSEHMNTVVKSYYSGIISQKLSAEIGFPGKEEAYICSLFHTFGKMIVGFAMPEKAEEIRNYSRERNVTEDAAALSLLGERYEEIGIAIAKGWNFPDKISYCMRKLRGTEITIGPGEIDKLHGISSFSNELANILSSSADEKEKNERVDNLIKAYKNQFEALGGKIDTLINASTKDLNEFSGIFNLDLSGVPFNRQLLRWVDNKGMPIAGSVTVKGSQSAFDSGILKTIDTLVEDQMSDSPESIFTKGIQDINNSILSNCSLNDIIRIVLETIYRGMQLSGRSNVLFFIKDTKQPVMMIRFGFGNGIEELKKWFKITLENANDIFYMAAVKQNDLVIKDVDAPEVRSLLPDWYKGKVPQGIFVVLLPIIINGKPIGMFYVEGEKANFGKVSGGHLNYLKILRDQTVMAVKQKQGY